MTKTEFLLIGSKQRLLRSTSKPAATINQFPIKQVSTVRFLDVHIDENLPLECHVNELSKKIASGISDVLGIRFHLRLYLPSTIHKSNLISITAARCGDPVPRVFLENCKNYKIVPHVS